MRLSLKLISFAVAAALALPGAGLVLSARTVTNVPETPPPTSAARYTARPAGDDVEGEVAGAVVALGRIEPVSRILRLAGPSGNDAGRVAAITVVEGQHVTRGQILGTLDTEARFAAAQALAEANVAVKAAQLAQKLAELDNTEKSLDAAVGQQMAEHDRAQWDFDRLGQLKQAGLYSDPALID